MKIKFILSLLLLGAESLSIKDQLLAVSPTTSNIAPYTDETAAAAA